MMRRALWSAIVVLSVAACSASPRPSPQPGRPGTPPPRQSSPASSNDHVPALTVDRPRVTVAPSRHLRDGEQVTVTVSGFGVGGVVRLSECGSVAAASDLGCGVELARQTLVVTNDVRTGSAAFIVTAEAPLDALQPLRAVTCRDQCVIVATLGAGYAFSTAPIGFGGDRG